jgi:hypothetical protein
MVNFSRRISTAVFAAVASLILLTGWQAAQAKLGDASLVIKGVELKDNQINVLANKTLDPGVYVLSSPAKLIVEFKNASLAKDAAKNGAGSGDMISAWSIEEMTFRQGKGNEFQEPIKSVRLKVDLTRDATYKLTKEGTGCSLALSEAPVAQAPAKTVSSGIPTQLYRPSDNVYQPPAKAEAPIPVEESKPTGAVMPAPSPSPAPAPRAALPQETAKAAMLTGLSFSSATGSFEAVITGDGSLSNYKFFKLDSPARVVVDIFGVTKNKSIKDELKVNNPEIKQVRVGAHPDSVRVVIEMTGNIKDVKISPSGAKLIVKIIY